MKLGVRAHDYGRHSAEELAELLSREGFEAAQVALHKAIVGVEEPYPIADAVLDEVRGKFKEKQVEITVLGCYMDLSAQEQQVREEHRRNLEAGLRYAKKLGAGMLGTETSYGVLDLQKKKDTKGQVWHTIDRLLETAEEEGAFLGIEPVAAHTLYSPAWTKELVKDMQSDRLQIIFDPVNLLTKERIQEQEELWRECFDCFGETIGAVHLKDFALDQNGNFVPCPLGKGLMRYEYLFDWLWRYKPELSILREELSMEYAQEDLAFMKKLLGR